MARRAKRNREPAPVQAFYLFFSIGLLLVAMEEIAWGQTLYWFETPSYLKAINEQGETTLHNIRGLQGRNSILRIAFGLGGLAGIWCSSHRHFRNVGAPFLLLPWFLMIALFAGLDLYRCYFPIPRGDWTLTRMAEVVEMLIGISGFLYIWLNGKMLSAKWGAIGSGSRPFVAESAEGADLQAMKSLPD